ncbi:hypothetical protein [Nonomuraea dietziae]|uniref:hypothetical protein n=1 Tax=Nonomuraea dietziae TaxID=65515 RepID=UPI0031DD0701
MNGRVEVAGPEQFRMDEFFREGAGGWNDPREGGHRRRTRSTFGSYAGRATLVPGDGATLARDPLQRLARPERDREVALAAARSSREVFRMTDSSPSRDRPRGNGADRAAGGRTAVHPAGAHAMTVVIECSAPGRPAGLPAAPALLAAFWLRPGGRECLCEVEGEPERWYAQGRRSGAGRRRHPLQNTDGNNR